MGKSAGLYYFYYLMLWAIRSTEFATLRTGGFGPDLTLTRTDADTDMANAGWNGKNEYR